MTLGLTGSWFSYLTVKIERGVVRYFVESSWKAREIDTIESAFAVVVPNIKFEVMLGMTVVAPLTVKGTRL